MVTNYGLHKPWLSFTHKVKWSYNHVILWDHVTDLKHCISMTTIPMAKNETRWCFTWTDFYPSSQMTIITWPCKITWQTKIITYPLAHCLWLSVLVSFHDVTRFFDQLVLQGHVNYLSDCITTTTRPVTTNLYILGMSSHQNDLI